MFLTDAQQQFTKSLTYSGHICHNNCLISPPCLRCVSDITENKLLYSLQYSTVLNWSSCSQLRQNFWWWALKLSKNFTHWTRIWASNKAGDLSITAAKLASGQPQLGTRAPHGTQEPPKMRAGGLAGLPKPCRCTFICLKVFCLQSIWLTTLNVS